MEKTEQQQLKLFAVSDHEAMDAICDIMSGAHWDADTMDMIADYVSRSGREIKDIHGEG